MFLPEGTYTVNVAIPDYATLTQDNVAILNMGITNLDFSFDVMVKGDINGDAKIDLADAIICLKVLSELPTSGLICQDCSMADMDVNNDGAIGMEEASYTLHIYAGIR